MVNSGRKFKQKESFTHKLAKELLHSWLTEKWEHVDGPIHNSINFIDNNTGENCQFGENQTDFVFMEYPITTDFPYLIDETMGCCDENGCQYRSKEKYCPCLKCPNFNFSKLEYVSDIALEHKGVVSTIIEIKHKHKTPPNKVERLTKNNGCTDIYEIDARHILGQIKKPKRLIVNRLI